MDDKNYTHCGGENEPNTNTKRHKSVVTDDELDSLLDDALKDFSKPDIAASEPTVKTMKTESHNTKNHGNIDFDEKDFGSMFTDEGIAKMAEELSKAFMDLPNTGPDLLKMAGGNFSSQSDTNEELHHEKKSIEENIEDAWKSMTQDLKDAEEEGPDDYLDKEFMNAMKGLGIDNADASPESVMSMMQGMMTNLLSKDILYPSLKEIQERYPAWLEENRSNLSDSEFTRFARQQELCSRVCLEFESEKEDDTNEIKKARMDKIMELMQREEDSGGDSGRLNLESSEQCVCM